MNIQAHLDAVANECARHTNAILEGGNEIRHETQDPAAIEIVKRFQPPLADFPYASSSPHGVNDESREFAVSLFATHAVIHGDRSPGAHGWRPVRHSKEQMNLSEEVKRFAINDEPFREMGDSEKHLGIGAVCRVCHIGDTFHSEGGKHCRIPEGEELACFRQRKRAWDFMPVGFFGTFANTGWRAPLPESPVDGFTPIDGDPDARCYASMRDGEAYVAAVRAWPTWRSGWRVSNSINAGPNAAFYRVVQ